MTSLPEHGHCENCGDPVPFGEYFCSDECSAEYHADVKEARRLDRRFYILMGLGLAAAAAVAAAVRLFIF